MKKTITSILIIAAITTSCENSTTSTTKTETRKTVIDTMPAQPQISEVFACPMHPEVTGKKGDKCPKCEMELTVPVK